MFSQLTQWLVGDLPVRRPNRHTGVPKLSVERLEARTVLSASIGVAPTGFEAAGATVWGHASNDWAVQPLPTFREIGPSHWEIASTEVPDQRTHGLSWVDRPDLELSFNGLYLPSPTHVVIVIASNSGMLSESPADNFLDPKSPLAAHSPFDSPGESSRPLAATAPAQSSIKPPDAAFARFDSAPNFFALPSTTSTTASTSTTVSLSPPAYDTAFHDYATERLLIAANLESAGDEDDADASDDFLKVDDGESNHHERSGSLFFGDDAGDPLDVLARERAAVDAVMAELHELDPAGKQDQHNVASKPATTHDPTITDPYDFMPTESQEHQPSTGSCGEVGMVWLEPNDDPNSSAFDLSAVFLNRLPTVPRAVVGVEASLGIYQAFDVGDGVPQASARDAAVIDVPATASQSAVPAEIAAGQKSNRNGQHS